MSVHFREDSILAGRIEDLKAEIASKDYQVIKAARLGITVDELYPGHQLWYQQIMEKLAELENIQEKELAAQKALETGGQKKRSPYERY